jgi:hypothetical protein
MLDLEQALIQVLWLVLSMLLILECPIYSYAGDMWKDPF